MATMALFNMAVNWFIRQRIDQIQNFMNHPIETQQGVLFSQLFHADETEYGKKYGFKDISSYRDFQQQVPIVNYEEFEPYIEKARQGKKDIIWPGIIRQFAKSSGTTNAKSKYIPITDESLEECHYKAGKDLISIYANNHPDNQLFLNKNLRLGGSSELYESFNTKFGDLSAILIENLPFWIEITTVPSKKTSLMSEWETKLKAIVSEVKNQDVGSLTGVPSWMMVLLQRILAETGKGTISDVFPNLEVFFHGGISFKPYKEQYRKIIGKDINYYEIYNASEGFFGIQDRSGSDEMLLMLDYGIFYEFIPMDKFDRNNLKAIPLEEVELGKNYAMVISTNGGLWRYLIGDTVRFTSLSPHRIQISGRTKHYINAFGEELIVDNAEKGLAKACAETGAQVSEYSAAPVFMDANAKCRHQWLIEFAKMPDSIEKFAMILDATLKEVNSDYEAKRWKDIALQPLEVIVARKGLFHDWLAKKGKLGGQHKVPRLSNTRDYIEEMIALNER